MALLTDVWQYGCMALLYGCMALLTAVCQDGIAGGLGCAGDRLHRVMSDTATPLAKLTHWHPWLNCTVHGAKLQGAPRSVASAVNRDGGEGVWTEWITDPLITQSDHCKTGGTVTLNIALYTLIIKQ